MFKNLFKSKKTANDFLYSGADKENQGALDDYNQAIQIDHNFINAYHKRG